MSGELDPEAYVWLSALTDELTEAQAKRLVDEVGVLGDEKEQELADSVLFVAARENLDVFKRLKEVSDMRFIRLLFQEEIDAEVAKVVAQKDAEIAQIADASALKDAEISKKDALFKSKIAEKDAEISMLRAQLAAAGIAAGSN